MPALACHKRIEAGNLNTGRKKTFASQSLGHVASETGPNQSARPLADHAILLAAYSPVPRADCFLILGAARGSQLAVARALAAEVRLRSSHRPTARPDQAAAEISGRLRSRCVAELRRACRSGFHLSPGAGVLLGNDRLC